MKNLFLLAAGVGRRLLPLTRDTPKSLLDLGNGSTLLGQQVDGAIESKIIRTVHVVTGYRSEQIEQKILEYAPRIQIETIFNPFFESTNAIVSVWCALHKMLEHDFILTNGDNLFRQQVLPELAARGDGIHLVTSIKDTYDDDDTRVTLNPDGTVRRVSKEVALTDAKAESVGLVGVFGAPARKAFGDKLLVIMRKKENAQQFWHHILDQLAVDGVAVQTLVIAHDAWAEVDFHADIKTIRREISAEMRERGLLPLR